MCAITFTGSENGASVGLHFGIPLSISGSVTKQSGLGRGREYEDKNAKHCGMCL